MSARSILAVTLVAAVAAGAVWAAGAGLDRNHDSRGTESCTEHHSDEGFSAAIAQATGLAERMFAGLRAPGLSLAVGVEGRLVWSLTCGYADRERRIAVTPSTRFRVGSVSKTLTSVALARLVETRRLRLDDPVQRFVPGFPRKRYPITPRQLAGHLAGVRHYRGREHVSRRHYRSVRDSLRVFARDPLLFRPGTLFSYSSYGWNLLGAAIEGASGRPFARFLASDVLARAGMRHTSLDSAGARPTELASPYEISDDGRAVSAPAVDLSNRWPSGGFLSTAEDLVRFGSAVVGGSLLRHETARLLMRSQRTRAGRPTGYGLGWEVHPTPFGLTAGHLGNVVGGTAFFVVHPERRAVVALTTNLGYATAASPPPIDPGVPAPPQLLRLFLQP